MQHLRKTWNLYGKINDLSGDTRSLEELELKFISNNSAEGLVPDQVVKEAARILMNALNTFLKEALREEFNTYFIVSRKPSDLEARPT